MRSLNFGSINIDPVYFMEHFVRLGETLVSEDYRIFAGGKGFNQFIGYFIAEWTLGNDLESALRFTGKAASVCVIPPGAADSIPKRMEIS